MRMDGLSEITLTSICELKDSINKIESNSKSEQTITVLIIRGNNSSLESGCDKSDYAIANSNDILTLLLPLLRRNWSNESSNEGDEILVDNEWDNSTIVSTNSIKEYSNDEGEKVLNNPVIVLIR